MLVEVARPVTLFVCILSLYAVFNAALLDPSPDLDQRIYDFLGRLALAAGICLISGLIFCAATHDPDVSGRLAATLPVRIFLWAAGAMVILFAVSWYLERHCIFYRDIHF
ncbi:MAG: hypothetical protein WB566_12540 [Terriglobales bacterium]